jgi:uncharacterized protein with von Willebrand factor type A (vWA) domain
MQKMFGDFIHALRHAGLPVSQAETLDALQAVRLIGLNNPTLLKSGLAMTLAKTREDLAQYEMVFDQFFSVSSAESENESNNEPDTDQQASSQSEQVEQAEQSNEPAQSSETADSKNTENLSPLAQQLMAGDQTSIQMAIAAAGEEAGASSMQMFTQKGVTRYRIMQKLGEGPLNTELAQLDKDNSQLALVADLRRKQDALREQVKDYVESQFLLYSKKIGANLRDEHLAKVRLSNIDLSYYKHMTSIVRKAAKQLASMHSRRRKVSKRGLLDVRRTIAANAAYDGFLFHTKWKSRQAKSYGYL